MEAGPYQKISTISAVGINHSTFEISMVIESCEWKCIYNRCQWRSRSPDCLLCYFLFRVHPPRIIGALQRDIASDQWISRLGRSGEDYAPIVINPDVTSPGESYRNHTTRRSLCWNTFRLISSKSVNRTWSITNNGLGYSSCEITFNWDSADVMPERFMEIFGVGEWRAASWASVANSVTATSITVTGVILSAEYAVAGWSLTGIQYLQNLCWWRLERCQLAGLWWQHLVACFNSTG